MPILFSYPNFGPHLKTFFLVVIIENKLQLLLASGLCRAELSNTITNSQTRIAILSKSWENLRLAFKACQAENPAGGCWDVSLNYGKISLVCSKAPLLVFFFKKRKQTCILALLIQGIGKLDSALDALFSAVSDKPNHSGTNLDLAEALDKAG